MARRQTEVARAGLIILLLIVAAVAVLFLLPTPKPARIVAAAPATIAETTSCQMPPADFSSPAVLAKAAPANLWKGWSYAHSISLTAAPTSALVDQPTDIRVSGLKPREPITLRASMPDDKNRTWSAQATFMADDNGMIDVARMAPRYGNYSGVHAMGLIWSMLPQNVKDPQETLFASAHSSYTVKLEAMAGKRILAQSTLTRTVQAPNVTKTTVSAEGLVGELYTPTTPGPHPAVIVLGGSEGGLYPQVNEAALFASHGYVALGLAYFQGFGNNEAGVAALPKVLVNIPLEYFVKAADWLKRQPGVDSRHLAIMGWSKGAEAALITAATFPKEFQAVIAFMPSSVVWSGINYGPGPINSSWTLHGKPLPFATPVINPAMFNNGKPMRFVSTYADGLKDTHAVEKAVIPVERIAGPVLLISAGDDQIWPSPLMASQIMQRLAAQDFAYNDESLCYAGAGHAILPPYGPTNASIVTVPGGSFAFGGNPTAYAWADRDAWSEVLAFLHSAFR